MGRELHPCCTRHSPTWCILIFVIRMNQLLRILFALVVSVALSLLPGGDTPSPEGVYFDALMRVREAPPVARELLLIESPERDPSLPPPIEVIWTLAELGAERALLPSAWLGRDGSASPEAAGPEPATRDSAIPSGVDSRLDEEFNLIDENVAELFEAIRLGSIRPEDADRFVAQLRRLVADSEARIREELQRSSDSAALSVERMIEVFSGDRLGTELSRMGISLPEFSSALAVPLGPGDGRELPFRRLPYASLTRYIFLVNRLETGLSALDEAGYFEDIDPRSRPGIMGDHVESLREAFYRRPTEDRATAWRETADGYFTAVATLLSEEREARLVEQLVRQPGTADGGELQEERTAQIGAMTQELSTAFAALREDYVSVMALRNEIAGAVGGSFVIFEDAVGDGRAVALNSVLVDTYLMAPIGWKRVLLLTAAGLLVALILAPFHAATAIAVLPAALLAGAGIFPALFLSADIWIDPASIATVLIGSAVAVILGALLSQWSVERALTGRAADRLPRPLLKRTLRRGGIPKGTRGRRRAVVVVMEPDTGPDGGEATETESFHRAISRRIRTLGGTVLGEEGNTVIACFETPPAGGESPEHRQWSVDARLARHAYLALEELLLACSGEGVSVHCGVDIGELIFYLSPIDGYRATGSPVTYARRLCGLTRKYRRQLLIGAELVSALSDAAEQWHFEEQGRLILPGNEARYPFYCTTERDLPSP